MVKLYVAAGTDVMVPLNNSVETAIARVPFCKPHSIEIVIRCGKLGTVTHAKLKANVIIRTFSTKVTSPASAK